MSDASRELDLSLFGEHHVERYLATDGAEGHIWNGAPCLVLFHTGRSSGRTYRTPLIYTTSGDDHIVVASMGGAPEHPEWYRNLVANPAAEIQVLSERIPVTASTAEGDEKQRLWQLATAVWPAYDDYQARTERVIPVVVLRRR